MTHNVVIHLYDTHNIVIILYSYDTQNVVVHLYVKQALHYNILILF